MIMNKLLIPIKAETFCHFKEMHCKEKNETWTIKLDELCEIYRKEVVPLRVMEVQRIESSCLEDYSEYVRQLK